MTLIILIGIFLLFFQWESIRPAIWINTNSSWWTRSVLLHLVMIGIVLFTGVLWHRWFREQSVYHLSDHLPLLVSAALAYILTQFVFYWWHRLKHASPLLWRLFHQIHHSPQRIETLTTFYKHPLEVLVHSLMTSAIIYGFLGISLEAGSAFIVFASSVQIFFHSNIKTPVWMGYVIQRPEMHRLHHERGEHRHNYSDLVWWDMVFGTYVNPKHHEKQYGFEDNREEQLEAMLLFKDVNARSGKVPINWGQHLLLAPLRLLSVIIRRLYGLRLMLASQPEDWQQVDAFQQKVLQQNQALFSYHSQSMLPDNQGRVFCPCLMKKGKIVGTISLFDPLQMEPFTAQLFQERTLIYDPVTTFEMTRVCLDQRYQRRSTVFYLILLLECYRFTQSQGRKFWLVCTHSKVRKKAENMGGRTRLLATRARYVPNGSPQSQYWKIIQNKTQVKNWQAYLLEVNQEVMSRVALKFFKQGIPLIP